MGTDGSRLLAGSSPSGSRMETMTTTSYLLDSKAGTNLREAMIDLQPGLLPDALVPSTSIAQSFSDPISKQRCEGRLRTSHGQTQVHIWGTHRLLERLPRLGECAKFES